MTYTPPAFPPTLWEAEADEATETVALTGYELQRIDSRGGYESARYRPFGKTRTVEVEINPNGQHVIRDNPFRVLYEGKREALEGARDKAQQQQTQAAAQALHWQVTYEEAKRRRTLLIRELDEYGANGLHVIYGGAS